MEKFLEALSNDAGFKDAIFKFDGDDAYEKIIEFSASKGIVITKDDLQKLDASIEQFNNLPEDQRQSLTTEVDDATLLAASGGEFSAGKAVGIGVGSAVTGATIAGGVAAYAGILSGIGTAIAIK